ncbi:ABC-type transport system, involved in lipoprotein release, permease component [Malonomonas rubra DSM 5091]|uniref:ABC-type transport system, involved in lipoprotein release, permease component n=1 Tax=Malonomonas rubra DSM 5091 TaxID=1122189 RepID=A0A1M6H783_MALRU|nr:ABC transporter permease [Malonomonas rubra]SHJ18101.1 ABC-type transport system, involved in lipoprotein release, permease component [Malonomonas rubra DSM 5091]
MARRLNILEHALSSLLRRKQKNLAIIVVYTLTVATIASVLFLTQSLRSEAVNVLAAAPDIVVQRLAAGRHDLIPIADAEQIRRMPGVGKVEPRVWGYYYDSLKKVNFTLMGVKDSPTNLPLLQGTFPANNEQCTLGKGIAEAYGVTIGDSLVLVDSSNSSKLYQVSGLFIADSELLTNDLILLQEAELRRFFKLPDGRATDLAVEVYNQREVATLAKKIKLALPDSRPIGKTEILHTYDTVFNWRSGIMLTLFASALIAFCILAWDKATGISADEKREIGILKAIGWDTNDVLLLKFWEGLAISLTAFLLGAIIAYLHVFFYGAGLLAPVLQGWSVLFPQFNLTPAIDLYQLFVLALLTIVPYIACTIVPAWKTAVTDPDSVMRS